MTVAPNLKGSFNVLVNVSAAFCMHELKGKIPNFQCSCPSKCFVLSMPRNRIGLPLCFWGLVFEIRESVLLPFL